MLKKHRQASTQSIHCAVITVSDTRDEETDKSGAIIKDYLQEADHTIGFYKVVPDEKGKLQSIMEDLIKNNQVDAIIFNGGTGIAKRDVTIESIKPYLDQELPGFGELFRYLSYEIDIGSASILSRAIAGIANDTAVFSIPGSSGAVKLAMEKIIIHEIGHIVSEIRKDL